MIRAWSLELAAIGIEASSWKRSPYKPSAAKQRRLPVPLGDDQPVDAVALEEILDELSLERIELDRCPRIQDQLSYPLLEVSDRELAALSHRWRLRPYCSEKDAKAPWRGARGCSLKNRECVLWWHELHNVMRLLRSLWKTLRSM